MLNKTLSQIKGSDEKRWAIESAANTLKEFFRIKADKPLLKAARAKLREEIANSKAALKTS